MKRPATLGLVAILLAGTALTYAQPAMHRRVSRPQVPETLRLLNQRIPETSFNELPFEFTMHALEDMVGINIMVRWDTLEGAGVERDTPITVKAKNLTFSQVLYLVMNEATGTDVVLAYRMSNNLLILSTEEDLGRELITKVYDVADLMVRMPNAMRPIYESSQGLGEQGGGGSSSIFGTQNQQQQDQQQQQNAGAPSGEMSALINVIQKTVEPDSWLANGSGRGDIQAYGNLLIITNTILVHQKIGGYVAGD